MQGRQPVLIAGMPGSTFIVTYSLSSKGPGGADGGCRRDVRAGWHDDTWRGWVPFTR